MFDDITISLTGVLSSFLGGSLTAFLFFLLFRPRIRIIGNIAKLQDDQGDIYYKFKFYNRSIFPAVNVSPTLYYGTPSEASDHNINIEYKEIPLTRHEPFYVPRWRFTTKKTKKAPHCIRVKCKNQDFENMLKDYGSHLELRVNVRHGFSNIASTKTRSFNREQLIIEGDFDFGNTKKISK